MATESYNLLSNASATGTQQVIKPGGNHVLVVNGTFSGATVTFQVLSKDGTNWVDVVSFTAAGTAFIAIAHGSIVRMAVSGSPSAIYATLGRVPV